MPASEGGGMRPELRRKRKALAGRYCWFLSGHVSIGSYLSDKAHMVKAMIVGDVEAVSGSLGPTYRRGVEPGPRRKGINDRKGVRREALQNPIRLKDV